MKMSKFIIVTLSLSSMMLGAEYFADRSTLEKLIDKPTCSIKESRLRESNIKFIDRLQRKIINGDAQLDAAINEIEKKVASDSYDCYVQLNMTSLYAQALDTKEAYGTSWQLYRKVLSFDIKDTRYRQQITEKAAVARQKYQQQVNPSSAVSSMIELKNPSSDEPSQAMRALALTISQLEKEIEELYEQAEDYQNNSNQSMEQSDRIIEVEQLLKNHQDQISMQRIEIESLMLELELSEARMIEHTAAASTSSDQINFETLFDETVELTEQRDVLSLELKKAKPLIQNLEKENYALRQQLEILDKQLDKLIARNSPTQGGEEDSDSDSIPWLIVIAVMLGFFGLTYFTGNSRKPVVIDSTANEFSTLRLKILEMLGAKKINTNDLGDFIYSYLGELLDCFSDDEFAIDLEKDELLESLFDKELSELKKYYKFHASKQMDKGQRKGRKDAASFKKDQSLPGLRDELLNEVTLS